MAHQKQNCKCGAQIINEHGIKTKFVRINANNTAETKCKKCGEFNLVPLVYVPPKE
jgi:hypothetical protein